MGRNRDGGEVSRRLTDIPGGGGGGGSRAGRSRSERAHLLAYLALFVSILPQQRLALGAALSFCLSLALGSLLRRGTGGHGRGEGMRIDGCLSGGRAL